MDIASAAGPLMWIVFSAVVIVLLALDLGVFHRAAHEVRWREAFVWSLIWFSLAMLFGGFVWFKLGQQSGLEFFTGYFIEESLSVDNIFIMLLLFASFRVPKAYQHRVLFWGILGAMVMRAVFIFLGAALVQTFHWVLYVFGVILVLTAGKLFFQKDKQEHPENSVFVKLFQRFVPAVPYYDEGQFITRVNGKKRATLLLLVLVAIEGADLVFAIDSIPAIFGITTDPFIVYTSNIFAILGLRSMFFVLAGLLGRVRYLKNGLVVILAFVGVKMLIPKHVLEIPASVSLGVILMCIAGAAAASWLLPEKNKTVTEIL